MEQSNELFEKLQKITTGERASLRRCCGQLLKDADGDAIMVFYRCLPYGVPARQEDFWFAAACFSCLWDPEDRGEPLEHIFAELKDTSSSMEHRLATLLDTKWETDGFLLGKLCRIMKMIRSKGLTVDCKALLEDLIYWNSSNQSVQRKWARAMYTTNNLKN